MMLSSPVSEPKLLESIDKRLGIPLFPQVPSDTWTFTSGMELYWALPQAWDTKNFISPLVLTSVFFWAMNEIKILLIQNAKFKPKLIKILYRRPKTIKLLEENRSKTS